MREQDWALLGIEPTTELAAIKKAYALKLKTTRPDDDAQAYQALRTAYERAQQWMEWQAAQPAEAPGVEAVDAADEGLVPAPDSAEHAVQRLHALWRQQGSPALLAAWPAARAMLDAQPLADRAEWSACFAHWVVEHDDLPDAFVDALNDYFDWQQDFRTERLIGKRLAEAVRQALRNRQSRQRAQEIRQAVRDRHPPPAPPKPPEPPSEALKEQVRPLHELDALRFSGAPALWLALLLRPMLARRLYGLDRHTLERCGIPPLVRSSLDRQLARARLLRSGLWIGLVLALFVLTSDNADMTTANMMMWCMGVISWLGLSQVLGALMHQGLAPENADGPAPTTPLQRWRRHPRQPVAGLGLIAVAAVLAAVGQSLLHADLAGPLQPLLRALPWIVLWAGTMLAWPLHPVVSPACVGLLVPAAGLLFGYAPAATPWAGVLAIALLYLLVGAARFEGRLGGHLVLDVVVFPVTNMLTMAVRWGWVFALLPSLLTLACLLSSLSHPPVPGLMLVWALTTLALQQLQHRIEPWALAKLSRASTPSAPG